MKDNLFWKLLNKNLTRVVLILWLMAMEFFGFKMLEHEEIRLCSNFGWLLWLLAAFFVMHVISNVAFGGTEEKGNGKKTGEVDQKTETEVTKKTDKALANRILVFCLSAMEVFSLVMLIREAIASFSYSGKFWLLAAFAMWHTVFSVGFCGKDGNAPFSLRNETIQKLFVGSVTKSNRYSIFVLFVFLSQITWCFDLGGKLFVEWGDYGVADWKWLIGFGLSVGVLFAIGVMFSKPNKGEVTHDKCKLLLSGFSGTGVIKKFNIEGAIRPIVQAPCDNSGNELDAFEIKEWMIVPSWELLSYEFHDDVAECCRNCNVNQCDGLKLANLIKDYNEGSASSSRMEKFEEIICNYVRLFYGKEIKVKLLKEVNYNDFEDCYNVVTKELRKKEKECGKDCYTVVHTSPGTAAVSAVMSTVAIKLDRQLVYTEQVSNGKIPRLLKVTMDVLTLKDWYEELSKDNE